MAAPLISYISPSAAYAGQAVTIHGSNLDSITIVKFGNVPASFFNPAPDSMSPMIAYPNESNTGDVVVSDGSSSSSYAFTFIDEPAFVPNATSSDQILQFCTGTDGDPTTGVGKEYYNFISKFTGEYFTIRDIGTSLPTGFSVDNICFFYFGNGHYGERNWQDNTVNALEFGIKGDGFTDNGDAFQNFCTYLSFNTNGNKVGVIPKDPREIVTIYLTYNELNISGSDVTLYIEADIQAHFTAPANLLSVGIPPCDKTCNSCTKPDYISNVRIIGNGCTLDMQGQSIPWMYEVGKNYCTVFFQYVNNGYIENLILLNGLVGCIKMFCCWRPVISNVTAIGAVNDNGIAITQDPCNAVDTDPASRANGLIIDSKAFNCKDFGITSFAAGYTRIINCESWYCGTSGPAAPTLSKGGSTGLPAGTYYYAVAPAIGLVEIGVMTDEAVITITAAEIAKTITVTWLPVLGASEYHVYRCTSSGAEKGYFTAGCSPFTDTGALLPNADDPQVASFPSGGGFSDEINPGPPVCNDVLFENCKAISCKVGGLFSSSAKVRIIGLLVDGITTFPFPNYQGHGISLSGNADFIVDNCDIRNISKSGIAALNSINETVSYYVGGIISNNNILNCATGGIHVQGCKTMINCFGNNLNAANSNKIGISGEIAVMNFGGKSDAPGCGTAVITGNKFTDPSSLSIQVQDIQNVFIENNAIENNTVTTSPILVSAKLADIESVAINGNSMQNSATAPANIASATVGSPSYNIARAVALGNTGDYTTANGISFLLGAGIGTINDFFLPDTSAVSTADFIADLSKGDLIVLPNLSSAQSMQFPAIVVGKVIMVWVTNTSTTLWTVASGTGIPQVLDATGTTVGTLSNGMIYRFVGYDTSPTTAWIQLN